jgi:hypothetical protein
MKIDYKQIVYEKIVYESTARDMIRVRNCGVVSEKINSRNLYFSNTFFQEFNNLYHRVYSCT